jgi:hypothetical protein
MMTLERRIAGNMKFIKRIINSFKHFFELNRPMTQYLLLLGFIIMEFILIFLFCLLLHPLSLYIYPALTAAEASTRFATSIWWMWGITVGRAFTKFHYYKGFWSRFEQKSETQPLGTLGEK